MQASEGEMIGYRCLRKMYAEDKGHFKPLKIKQVGGSRSITHEEEG